MEPVKHWQALSDENKSLVKGATLAALGLYVLLQLATLFLHQAITKVIKKVSPANIATPNSNGVIIPDTAKEVI